MAKSSSSKAVAKKSSAKKSSSKKTASKNAIVNSAVVQGFAKGFGEVKKIKRLKEEVIGESSFALQPIEASFKDMSERLLRIQRDLMMPSMIFEKAKIQNTITIFGSAQIKSESVAKANLAALKKNLARQKKIDEKDRSALEAAQTAVKMSKYYTDAEVLARRIQEWTNLLKIADEDKFYIMTGGGPGIMEAANKGAFMAGGKTAGLTIFIPDEQRRNDYVSPDAWFNFNYFLMRKFWLLFFAKALVVFPGGTGTFDEFFEVFTLMKTRKTKNYIPIVLYGKEFWTSVVDFKQWIKTGVINEEDTKFFHYADDVDEAYNYITSELERIYF